MVERSQSHTDLLEPDVTLKHEPCEPAARPLGRTCRAPRVRSSIPLGVDVPSARGGCRAQPASRKVVGSPPLIEMGAQQRREFHEALLEAQAFEDLAGKFKRRGRVAHVAASSAGGVGRLPSSLLLRRVAQHEDWWKHCACAALSHPCRSGRLVVPMPSHAASRTVLLRPEARRRKVAPSIKWGGAAQTARPVAPEWRL